MPSETIKVQVWDARAGKMSYVERPASTRVINNPYSSSELNQAIKNSGSFSDSFTMDTYKKAFSTAKNTIGSSLESISSVGSYLKGGALTLGVGYLGSKAVDYVANTAADYVNGLVDSALGKTPATSSTTLNSDVSSTIPTPPKVPVASLPNQSIPPSNVSPSTGNSIPSSNVSPSTGGSVPSSVGNTGSSIDLTSNLTSQASRLTLITAITASNDRLVATLKSVAAAIVELPKIQKEADKKYAADSSANPDGKSVDDMTAEERLAYIQNGNSWGYGGFNKKMIEGMTGISFPSSAVSSGSSTSFGSPSVYNPTSGDIKSNSTAEDAAKVVAALQAKNLELQNELLEYQRTPASIELVEGEVPVKISPRDAEFASNAHSGLKNKEINNLRFDDDDFDLADIVMPFLPFAGVSSDLDAIHGIFNTGITTNPFNLDFSQYGNLSADNNSLQ